MKNEELQKLKDRFEAWAKSHFYPLFKEGDDYGRGSTHHAWVGYQAGIAERQAAGAMSDLPTVPMHINALITAYGDARADMDGSPQALKKLIQGLREWASAAQPVQEPPSQQPVTAEQLLRVVFQRPDISEAIREWYVRDILEENGELMLNGDDFRAMAEFVAAPLNKAGSEAAE